jgi:WD40 repeat protein
MSIGGYKYSYGFKIPASSRVLALDLHPVKDWILIAEESYTALLWNYTQKTVLQVYGKSTLHNPDPAGLIKDVKFWDFHVLRWKWLHPGIDVELDAFQGNSVKRRWVVIAMEYKIVFIDYNTGEINSILLSQLDGKTITSVEILDSTYIAIGHADGSIRIWDTLQWSRVKTFPKGTHFKGITHLLSFSQNLRQRAFLLSSSGDGVIGVWNVDTCTTLPAYKIPVGKPAHDSMIYNISFDAGLMNLVTVGSDKYINVWNVLNSTELNRFKNIKDSYGKTAINARHWRHPLFEEGTLIMHGKSSQVYLLSSTSQVNKKKANFEIILDLRSKYNDKTVISDIRIHPLNPSLLFILTQDGIYTLLFEPYTLPPAAFNSSHISNIPPKQLQDATVNSHFAYIARGNQLYSVLYCRGDDGKIISQDIALCTFKRNYGLSVQLKLSASGLYLAVHSVKTGMYELFRIPNSGPNAPPDSIKLGSASELVWHSSLDIFAVISPIGEDDTIGSFIGKVCYTLVLIYEINKRGQVALIYRDEHLNNPTRIFGGPLLGISHGEEVNNTQLYFWENMVNII